jgi:hypothetical protein
MREFESARVPRLPADWALWIQEHAATLDRYA